mgnify:CR=1 FL=1
MGAINFGTLTKISRLALVNEPETEEEQEELYFEVEETQAHLDKLNLYYFSLSIEYGYYEGFYLKLNEENTKYIYTNTKEKQEVLKELTAIKNILIELVKDNFLIGCYPSWVTTRLKTAETIKQIKSIIKELKAETMASYTEYTANKQNKSIFDIAKEY